MKPIQWSSRQLFNYVHSRKIIYNTCWEDPELDRQALNINEKDKMLVLTSAGCNVLDYALENPKHIYAVDMNPRQNALLELKIAGIRSLSFEDFFHLFGKGQHRFFKELYQQKLREHLSPQSAEFWDRHPHYFLGAGNQSSFYFRGASGRFALLISNYFRIAQVREWITNLFQTGSLSEQTQLYYQYIRPRIWNGLIRWLLRQDATLTLIGVPRAQKNQIQQQYSGGLSQFIMDCIDGLCTRSLLKDNYFWSLYFHGRYTQRCCPRYLQREHFMRLKAGPVDRISTHTQTIHHFLKSSEAKISKYVLLDHMDWLADAQPEALQKEWQQIISRSEDKARVIWRSG